MSKRCAFIKRSGYWKGYQCGNDGKHQFHGKWYCVVHYGMITAPKPNKPQQEEK